MKKLAISGVITLFACEICGLIYFFEEAALECEEDHRLIHPSSGEMR